MSGSLATSLSSIESLAHYGAVRLLFSMADSPWESRELKEGGSI